MPTVLQTLEYDSPRSLTSRGRAAYKAAFFFAHMAGTAVKPRTIIYIDGLNFYYGAVKGTPHKWLRTELRGLHRSGISVTKSAVSLTKA